MEYVNKITQNSFELSSKKESYLLGLWLAEEKIRIVVIKNEEKYERLYSKEDLQLSHSITKEIVNEMKELIEFHPQEVEISMSNDQITVNINKNNEAFYSFQGIPIKTTQSSIQQPTKTPIEKKKEEEEIDPQTLSTLCGYLNKLNLTISSMEKRIDILSNQVEQIDKTTTHSIEPKSELCKENLKENIMANASDLEKKLQNVDEQIFEIVKK